MQTKRYIADADPHNMLEQPTDGGYFCSDPISTSYIFTSYDFEYNSISVCYNNDIDDTKAAG